MDPDAFEIGVVRVLGRRPHRSRQRAASGQAERAARLPVTDLALELEDHPLPVEVDPVGPPSGRDGGGPR
jgi:hypothetical protein